MMSSALQITNLVYRYAELLDSGDLEGASRLFEKARIKVGESILEGSGPILALWRSHVRLFPCGTPRTKHVITNPIVEIDDAAGTATCRSYYTVFQATEDLPLQPIAAGRYHDAFRREHGTWHFSERNYSLLDLIGDHSQHLLVPASELFSHD